MQLIFMCLKIFLARIFDVSLGTVRTVFIVKGKSLISTGIAFVEVLIWYWVAKETLVTSIDSIFVPISYAAGYATGNFLGLLISKFFIDQFICVQVITNKQSDKLVKNIKKEGYGLSVLELKKNDDSTKDLIYIQTRNSNLKKLKEIINKFDSKAFVIVNETKYVNNGFIK